MPLRSRVTAMSKPIELPAFGVEEIDVGLADRDADDVGAARRADHRVGDLGIGHQHVLDVAGQVDDDASCRRRAAGTAPPVAVNLHGRRRRRSAAPGSAAAAGAELPSKAMTTSAASVAVRMSVAWRHERWLPLKLIIRLRADAVSDGVDLAFAACRPALRSGLLASSRLRSASDSVPSCRDCASVSAWRGVSSRVAVLPTTTRWPFFSSTVWSIARTRTLARMVSLVGDASCRSCRACGAPRQDHVDAVVRQDEAAGAGFRRNFGRDRAHAGRQDRRHEACGAVGLDQLGFADRFARGERRAGDRAGELLDRVRPRFPGDVGVAGGGLGPGLPGEIVRRDGSAHADIALGDQHVDGRKLLDDRRRRRLGFLLVVAADEERGRTACGKRDTKHQNTRGFHNASLTLLRD